MMRYLVSLGVLAGVAAAAAGLSFVPAMRPQEPAPRELAQTVKLDCPVGGKVLTTGEDVQLTPLRGEPQHLTSPGETAVDGPSVLTSDALLSAGVLTAEPEAYTTCPRPASSGMLLVPNPKETELLIINGDAGEAAVDLTLLGPEGPINAMGARGISLTGEEARQVALSVLAPEGPVGVQFQTSQGRVAVIARSLEGRPTRFVSPTTQGTAHLVPPIPGAGKANQLIITNPTEVRASVGVTALGQGAAFTPASAAEVSVPPNTTMTVDLGEDLAQEPAALRVASDQPVAVTAVTTLGDGQPSSLVATDTSAELAAYVPARSGELLLTNPGIADATATVLVGGETEEVALPAARTVKVGLSDAGGLVTVSANAELLGSVATGGIIIALSDVSQGQRITGTSVLDPGLR